MMGNDDLESSIYLKFITTERTIRSNFAGTGQSRKRSISITRVLAEHLVSRLSVNYTFTKSGNLIGKAELIEFVSMHLWAVPDDVAKASGTRNTDISQPAAKAIAHGLFLAIDMEYIRSYESQDFLDPSSPRYVNRPKET
ncbi:hypothetical protein CFBP4996_15415 [Agrobacterium leguminum]|uniref:Uncharacterized protein n=1 Tax=Agrobacterium deltaense NCPPB 1641 TaxID=1183425 RepID=A0A1S7U295_9HYPH|nr:MULTISPECIES: hypothetical protein [Agrobacterium]WFS67416.1 hypothetical protein CFBP4996_15415 [Agrobacterium leguminum]CVI60993.1 conserved hypothetical protein [Agrobacterium deltaense NCPPB 1641]